MKRTAVALSAALLSAALAATAAQPEASKAIGDYAYRWPLKTEGQNAAWQFELTPEVYAALIDPELGDFVVLNADGQAVPVARLTIDPATRPGVAQAPLPVFALPRRASTAGTDDLSLRLERDGSGRLRLLQVDMGAPATPATLATPAPAMPAPIDYVMDADLGRDPKRPATVDRLDLRWPEIGDIHARFAVEGSDDLEHWQMLVEGAAVVSLRRGGSVLQRRDIALPPTSLRYLRLRQLDVDPVPNLQVTARRTRGGAHPPQWRRMRAEFVDTAPDAFGKGHLYRYRLPAKLPVGRVGVILGADNATAEVILDAQNGSVPGDEAWTPIGRTLLFRLQQNGLRIDNEDYALTAPIAAREWRLRSPIALTPAPTMDVAYLPDRFVFLAQGSGPYTLAAGSRDARRDPLPVEQALAPLRSRLGAEWSPPVATLGARSEAAGTQAYAEKATPPDWRRWLLWGFLVLGAAIVGGFALSLLRARKTEA
ncbi:MAG: DUF3999 domain-containing protein [Pseudomonadota bacterium]